MNWISFADNHHFTRRVLEYLDADPYSIADVNPITQAIKSDCDFYKKLRDDFGDVDKEHAASADGRNLRPGELVVTTSNLARAATICQMIVFDNNGGPEADGKRKALRRHWYQWFKIDFAQALASQDGMENYVTETGELKNDLKWTSLLSKTYVEFVKKHGATYRDLWVRDASRMMSAEPNEKLYEKFNVILAVEKDSLFEDFTDAARAMGIPVVLSGKGKNSMAAMEKLLRDLFDWSGENNPFGWDRPLVIVHISDWDYDGRDVIGPTFGNQARRYTDEVIEVRVGIDPDHLLDANVPWSEKMYQVKIGANKARVKWAESYGLHDDVCCSNCEKSYMVVGIGQKCDSCGHPLEKPDVQKNGAYGFEVEALPTREYYHLIVEAVLRAIDFDSIIEELRDECTADAWDAATEFSEEVARKNSTYAELQAELGAIELRMKNLVNKVYFGVIDFAYDHESDFRDEEPDPDQDELTNHVVSADESTSVWRPFDPEIRTKKLLQLMRAEIDIDDWVNEEI